MSTPVSDSVNEREMRTDNQQQKKRDVGTIALTEKEKLIEGNAKQPRDS